MDRNRKTLTSVEIKSESKGEIRAVFSTLGVVDKDGDITVKGAMRDGSQVRISAYNHKSWEGALPVGKGVVREVGNEVILEGQFFMNTTHGRDTFETVKAMGDLQEFSYGFDVIESEEPDGEAKSGGAKRILKSLSVHEVSPVLLGAGIGTRTLGVKSSHGHMEEECEDEDCPEHPAEDEEERERRRQRAGRKAEWNAERRREAARRGQAMPDGSFPIADREDLEDAIGLAGNAKNPAAARRHIMRRARAMGLTDMIPDTWKSSLADELKEVMASVSAVRERTAEVMAMRTEKGTGSPLGKESAALIEEVRTGLKSLEGLLSPASEESDLDSVNDELRAAYLRFVRDHSEGV